MKERSIIFSSEMVRAILDGRKTMTRRPVKPQPTFRPKKKFWDLNQIRKGKSFSWQDGLKPLGIEQYCPYGQAGDRLWVRETWKELKVDDDLGTRDYGIIYKADGPTYPDGDCHWKSSIFMPRWASRITLEIVKVRVERLQEIGIEDIHKEGFERWRDYEGGKHVSVVTATNDFWRYWNSLYTKKPEYQWKANPWVWVIEFTVNSASKPNPNKKEG